MEQTTMFYLQVVNSAILNKHDTILDDISDVYSGMSKDYGGLHPKVKLKENFKNYNSK
jgi:hypothetical protein